MPPGRRLQLPEPDRVPAVGQLVGFARRRVQPEQLAVNPHVHDREDGIPVGRPGRIAELVGQVGSQDSGRTPAGRGQEDVAVVVLLEPLVGARQKQHPGAVRGHLGPRLRHVVGGQPAGVASVGSHHPDLAGVAILEHRIRSAMQGDPLAVAREVIVDDGIVAFGHPRRCAGRHCHRPEVAVLEVLFEGVDVVLLGLTGLLLERLLVGSEKEDGAAVGRPRDAGNRRRMVGELTPLAPLVAQQVDLGGVRRAARSQECHPVAIRRPAGTRLTLLTPCQLDDVAAIRVRPPDVADGPVRLPVGLGEHVQHLPAIG